METQYRCIGDYRYGVGWLKYGVPEGAWEVYLQGSFEESWQEMMEINRNLIDKYGEEIPEYFEDEDV